MTDGMINFMLVWLLWDAALFVIFLALGLVGVLIAWREGQL